MNGKRPAILRMRDGSLSDQACFDLCSFWAEEDDWEGRTHEANYWKERAEEFKWSLKMNLKAWTSSPAIEDRLAEEAAKWQEHTFEWDDRMDYFAVHPSATI